jgi:glycosyltransferase involved in cell wall biosynthesis
LTLPDKKNRFLFVMGFTCPFPGAGWWRIFYLARYFYEKNHECYVLSSLSLSTVNSPKVVRNEKIYIYNMVPYIGINNPLILFLNNALTLIAFVPSFFFFRPSTVVISVPPTDQLLPVFLFSKIMKRKIIIDYRDEFEDYLIMNTGKWSFFYRFLKRFLASVYRNATMVTPVTHAVAKDLKHRGVHNVKVTYDGVDTKIFHPYDKRKMRSELHIPQESFVIAYLGNISKPYRVDLVARALKNLNERDLKPKYSLIFMGGGDVQSIVRLANSLGIRDSVKYFGVINNPIEIAKIISSADCGVIPYDDNPLWQKTFSTKLFEYCALGLPIIATVHGSSALAAVIRANHMGLVTEPINSEDLATSIETLNINKELRIKMSLSALKFARIHDKEKLARDLLEALESLP